MEQGELAVCMVVTGDYSGVLLFAFENGKIAKVPLKSYETKTNRKKLTGAYCDKSTLVDIAFSMEDREYVLTSSAGRMLLFHSGAVNIKSTRNTQGVAVLKLKKGHRLMSIREYVEGEFVRPTRYRTRTLPAVGALPSQEDSKDEQLSLI